MRKVCHEIDFEIMGSDMQIVEITLDPQETVISEAGAFNYMDEGIQMEARLGDGSPAASGLGGVLSVIYRKSRMLTGRIAGHDSFYQSNIGATANRICSWHSQEKLRR